MEIAWEIVRDVYLIVDILQYLHVNLLIFRYSLIARSTYEPIAYYLHDAVSSLLRLSLSSMYIISNLQHNLLCDGRLHQTYLEVRHLFFVHGSWHQTSR